MKRNKSKCKANKLLLIRLYGRTCMLCGKKLTKQETTYHHIVPLSEEGTNEIENGSLLGMDCCHKCLHKNTYTSPKYQESIIRIRRYMKEHSS